MEATRRMTRGRSRMSEERVAPNPALDSNNLADLKGNQPPLKSLTPVREESHAFLESDRKSQV